VFENGNIRHLTGKDGLFSNILHRFVIDNNGDVLNCWYRRLSRVRPNEIYTLTHNDGISDNEVSDMTRDREGNYWLGTKTGGLNKLRKSVIKVIGKGRV